MYNGKISRWGKPTYDTPCAIHKTEGLIERLEQHDLGSGFELEVFRNQRFAQETGVSLIFCHIRRCLAMNFTQSFLIDFLNLTIVRTQFNHV